MAKKPNSFSVSIGPNEEAARNFRDKTVAPTGLSSRQIEENVTRQVRNLAFFSAKVSDAELLNKMKSRIQLALDMPEGAKFVDRAAFVADVRRDLEALRGDSGKLTDIESNARLSLVYNMNVESAYERARWTRDHANADILDEFPCSELVRLEAREHEREWNLRWQGAGGKLSKSGRMIARKDDPIWTKISRFGNPWPPFDYNSGMGLADIDRDEAIAEGVITEEDVVAPNFDQGLKNEL